MKDESLLSASRLCSMLSVIPDKCGNVEKSVPWSYKVHRSYQNNGKIPCCSPGAIGPSELEIRTLRLSSSPLCCPSLYRNQYLQCRD